MVRDFIAAFMVLSALPALAFAVKVAIWPPERHPLVIDAKAPGCPGLRPLPRNGGPAPPPLSDTRRIA